MAEYNRSRKRFRDFILKIGEPDNDYGREIIVRARSSLEAGLIITKEDFKAKHNTYKYQAHSLIDCLDVDGYKEGARRGARRSSPIPDPGPTP